MQLGLYKGRRALLWDNSIDRDFNEAIREARFKANKIQRIVVKIENRAPTYATKALITWFLNQRFSCGQEFTHRLNADGTVRLVSRMNPYKHRIWIPTLQLLWDGTKHFLRPGCHVENTKMGISHEKLIYNLLAEEWKYEPARPVNTDEKPNLNFIMFQPLVELYEVDDESFYLIDEYIKNQIPISRLPQDPMIYEWCCLMGIAPRLTRLDDPSPTTFHDPDKMIVVGKASLMDDEEYFDDTEEA